MQQSASPKPPTKPRSRVPKPTQTYEEIDSEDDVHYEEPRFSGALRGLNPNNMLPPPHTQKSIEARDALTEAPLHETRSQRHGKTNVNYSQKYHPMDDVTRPKRAQRITASRSISATGSRGESSSSDDELELSSGEGTDSERTDEDVREELDEVTVRRPDPRATRHSARSEALKSVNYSKAHHPQDHSLPGYQHRAKRKKQSQRHSKPPKKRARTVETIALSSDKVIDSDSDGDGQAATDTAAPPTSPPRPTVSSPRKHLKTLGRGHKQPRRRTSDEDPTSEDRSTSTPKLPRDESSLNPAEAIIRGVHAVAAEHRRSKDDRPPPSDNSSVTHGSQSQTTRALGTQMMNVLDDVETPAGTNSDPTTEDGDEEPLVENLPAPGFDAPAPTSPKADMSKTLITPNSVNTQRAPASTNMQATFPELLKERPSLTSRAAFSSQTQPSAAKPQSPLKPSRTDDERASSGTGQANVPTKVVPQQDVTSEARGESLQATNEEPGGLAIGDRDFSQRRSLTPSHGRVTTNSPFRTAPMSRQVSRDTLPDDGLGSSSFFRDAMAGTQSAFDREYDDDLLHTSTCGFSESQIAANGDTGTSIRSTQNAKGDGSHERSDVACSEAKSSQGDPNNNSPELEAGHMAPSSEQFQSSTTRVPPARVTAGLEATPPDFSSHSMLLRPTQE